MLEGISRERINLLSSIGFDWELDYDLLYSFRLQGFLESASVRWRGRQRTRRNAKNITRNSVVSNIPQWKMFTRRGKNSKRLYELALALCPYNKDADESKYILLLLIPFHYDTQYSNNGSIY